MRVKYIRTNDLNEMESTVNLLLMQGWDRDSLLQKEEDGYYLICLINYDRIPRASARGNPIQPSTRTCLSEDVAEWRSGEDQPEIGTGGRTR